MTLAEAAKLLGILPGTLKVQIHNGKLRARKVGPIWTVTPREVERYRRENLRRPAPEDADGFPGIELLPSGRVRFLDGIEEESN